MNKIYRLVWNKSLNLWTVVSENARGVTKKRNVVANISTQTLVPFANVVSQHFSLKPSLIAIALSSVFFSTGAFSATNTGGGTSNTGSSMAISPTAAQCGTGGEASVSGGNGTAVGCGNNIAGTNANWQQGVVNRRGAGNVAYGSGVPTGNQGGVFSSSTAVGRQNTIRGVGGATVVGAANVSQSGSDFHNVLMGQGNSAVGTGGYNVLMGVGNQVVDAANATPDGTGVGTNSIAIGIANRVTGQTAIAFGRQSYADADYAIAQGNTATVNRGATGGIALGYSATTSGQRGIAIGSSDSPSRDYDLAASPHAAGVDSIAMGTRSKATGNETIAVGRQSTAGNARDIAIGQGTTAQGTTDNGVVRAAVAVGDSARATGRNTVALGQASIASAQGATALSAGAQANGEFSTATGNLSKATANFTTATGNQAAALAEGATVTGSNATASGVESSAFGAESNASGNLSVAVGAAAVSAGENAVAVGPAAKANSANDIAIGNDAATATGTGGNNIAMGNGVTTGATGQNVSIGSDGTTANSETVDGGAVAIGRNQVANGDGAVAIGDPNRAVGSGAVALGKDNTAAGDNTASTLASGAVAIGNTNLAVGQGSVALGNTSTAAAAGAIALGDTANAQATDVDFDSVQVGDVNIDGTTGKITGVADGTVAAGSKDAVNGGQLNDSVASTGDILGGGVTNEGGKLNGPFTVNDKGYDTVADAIQGEAAAAKTEVEAGKNMTVESRTGADGQTIYEVATADDVSFDSVQVGDVNIDGTTGKISGVTDGTVAAGSKDAVNGGQLHGVADSVRNSIGGETVLNPNGSVTTSNVGNTGENNIHDAIDSVRGQAVAAKTTVTEGDNMVVTQSTNPDGSTNYDVATAKDVKFDSVTSTDAEGNETLLDAKGVSLKDQDGNTTILGQDGLGFADPMGNSVGPRISVSGIDAGNTVITGVAPGRIATDSQDAINGSQLKGVADSVAGAIGGSTTVNPDGSITTSNIGGTGKNNINDAIGAVGKAAQAAKTTVSKADGDENVTVTSRQNADGSTDYEVGLSKDVKVDSVTAGDTVINGDGLTIAGGPSVTKEGIDAGDNKVTGVADGTVAAGSKEAVNGGQLYGVADSVKNVVGGNATVNPDGSITTSNVGGTGENNIDDAINSVRGAAAAAKSSVSNKDGNISVIPTTKNDGSKDYEVGLAKDIRVDSVTAANQVNVGGAEGTTIAADGVRIVDGPSMTKGGINAGDKKVTGVADGAIAAESKDAINGSQLHKSYENVGNALGGGAGYDPSTGWKGPSYEVAGGTHNNVGDALNALNSADQALGDRITNLGDQMQQAFYDTNQRIDDVKKMANAGVAAAMALETAPYISGKYTYAVGAAYHGGENAVGVTLRKTADNGRWSLTTGVAAASQGDPSFRVGLSGVFD